ncbi:MAG: cobalt transporter CbiM [Deltaproteobacteria bacterium]|jgi:cobalt/nickel transport system permease protein|nr:cobalt transporter CbiM [Deltaproteobacteria bacterium]
MHISEGVLSAPVLATGAALAAAGLVVGLRSIRSEEIPKASILSAVFFVASLIHVNIGPSSTHLVLNGLIGIVMGLGAFPIIFLGLLLQGLLFGFGGLTTLGVNTFNMAAPAVLFGLLLRPAINSRNVPLSTAASLLGGALPVLASAILVALSLFLTGSQFRLVAYEVMIGNLPVVIVEGLVVMFAIRFLKKVRPEVLEARPFQGGGALEGAAV